MLSLNQAARRRGQAGSPLPTVYKCLEQKTIRIYRSQLTIVFGPAGSGKSLLTGNLLAKMRRPALAFILDQDQLTAAARFAAMETGQKFLDVKGNIDGYADTLTGPLGHIQACFKAESMADINLQIDAYCQRYGEPPEVLLLDNLGNMTSGYDDEWAILKALCLELDELARELEIAVIGCHHASDSANHYEPLPRSAMLGKVSQYPRLILSVGLNPITNDYKLAAVKNSSGEADQMALKPVVMHCDPASMRITEVSDHPQVRATLPGPSVASDAASIIGQVREKREAARSGGFGGF